MRLNQDAPKLVDLARYTVPVAAVILVVGILSGLLYVAAELFLLLFVGILLSLLLRAVARPLEVHMRPGIAFTLATLVFFAVISAMLLFFVPLLVDGFAQLVASLPKAVERIGEVLEDHPGAMRAIEDTLGVQGAGIASETLARVSGIFSTVVGVVFALLVVVFTGFYLAAEPDLYRRGLLRLLPLRSRAGADALLDELGGMLTRWMFGQFVSMSTIGVLIWLGLSLLGVPLAATLALAAALLTFIPTIGPILAAIPAVLVGFSVEPLLALWVALLYLVVESLESYLVTPLVQRQVVHLPPVLVLGAQLLLAVLYGLLGLFVAAPLTVAFMVLIRRLYVEGVLGDTTG